MYDAFGFINTDKNDNLIFVCVAVLGQGVTKQLNNQTLRDEKLSRSILNGFIPPGILTWREDRSRGGEFWTLSSSLSAFS